MACFHPLLAVDYGIDKESGKHHISILNMARYGSLSRAREFFGDSLMMLPCNKCIGCAKDYARAWQCRIMCEYRGRIEDGDDKACFLTLTYNDEPLDGDAAKFILRHFIKDLRNKFGNGIKFFACTERGSLTKRLHHHAIIFGVDFSYDREVISKRGLNYVYRSSTLESLWTHGFSSIGSLDVASAGYVSKYCDKKKISHNSDGESVIMSRGLGENYFNRHKNEILNSDYLYFEGNKFKIPRIFLRWMLKDDFYLRIQAEDYQDRKRNVAQSFRYSKCKSFVNEEEAMMDTASIKEYKQAFEEALRDVY